MLKKLIWSAPVLAALASQAHAAVVLTQGFDDIAALAGWSLQNNSQPLGLTNWFQGNDTVFVSQSGANNAYIAANYNNTTGGTGTISNWLLTPEISLSNGTAISFFTRTALDDFPDRLQVRLSTAGSSINVGSLATDLGDFTELLLDINPTLGNGNPGYPEAWTSFTANVTGLGAPTTGRFAFRYFVTNGGPSGANSNYIGIDTVTVRSPDQPPVVVPTPGSLALLGLGLSVLGLTRLRRRT